jgi:ZIP family zinc transporter
MTDDSGGREDGQPGGQDGDAPAPAPAPGSEAAGDAGIGDAGTVSGDESSTSGVTETEDGGFDLSTWAIGLIPLLLLGVVVGGFVLADPTDQFQRGEPTPDVTVSHHTVPDDETIVLHVTNDGSEPVRIEQVLVDDAYWDHQVLQDGEESRTIEPRESARVEIPKHWQAGWDYHVTLVLDNGATFGHTIVAIQETPEPGLDMLWTLALIGLFVGVIPVALGMAWFPFIRSMDAQWFHAILAFSAGVLAFLAVDAGFEALELAEQVPGAYEGTLLVALGAVGAALSVQAVSAWREGRTEGRQGGLYVAYLVAIGIGLHNLAEGLAIGSSFALGRVSLGAFLVVGFMLHNVTEGPAVVAPVARGEYERPALWHFVALGAIAGAPVILGGWIGGLSLSPTVSAFFLALGVGAIAQVLWELAGLIRNDGGEIGSTWNVLGFLGGFAVMYATDLLIVL